MIYLSQYMKRRGSRKGFTLIELLVAIAIIAVLTAVVTANLRQARVKSRDAKRIADVKNIQLALQQFFERCRTYPSALSPTNNANGACPSGVTLGSFMSRTPVPPAGSVHPNYNYSVYTPLNAPYPTTYHLGAQLEDALNPYLGEDADVNTTSADGWSSGFNGTDPLRYDVFPR